jgi:hypothetical protein
MTVAIHIGLKVARSGNRATTQIIKIGGASKKGLTKPGPRANMNL